MQELKQLNMAQFITNRIKRIKQTFTKGDAQYLGLVCLIGSVSLSYDQLTSSGVIPFILYLAISLTTGIAMIDYIYGEDK